jgi:hypothetical protein
MIYNDDWVAFMKESKSRFASYNAEKSRVNHRSSKKDRRN